MSLSLVLRDSAHNSLATCIDLQNQTGTVKVEGATLTKEQRVAIASHLAHFSGQRVAAYNDTFDVEASVFASEVLRTLGRARWDTHPNFGIDARLSPLVRAPSIPETGVLVQATEQEFSQAAANAIVRESRLSKFGQGLKWKFFSPAA
jgi:hypothetical protein